MAKTKEPKAGKKGRGKGAGGAPKVKKVKVKVKGAFLDRVTNLVAVLFGVSLVAQQLLVAGPG